MVKLNKVRSGAATRKSRGEWESIGSVMGSLNDDGGAWVGIATFLGPIYTWALMATVNGHLNGYE
jgi:hypothetical protein